MREPIVSIVKGASTDRSLSGYTIVYGQNAVPPPRLHLFELLGMEWQSMY